jgi:hypothetical protein
VRQSAQAGLARISTKALDSQGAFAHEYPAQELHHENMREACVRKLILTAGAVVLAAAMGYFVSPRVTAHGGGRAAFYNIATETSVSGTLAQPPARGRMGMYLSVQRDDGAMMDVRVAPRSYLAARGVTLLQGDQLEFTGSKVVIEGTPVLLAREITKDGRTLSLRDRSGHPLWRN